MFFQAITVALLVARALAEDTTSPLTFSYNTFLNGTVKTTSTTYASNVTASARATASATTTSAVASSSYLQGHGWESWPSQWQGWQGWPTWWSRPSPTSARPTSTSVATSSAVTSYVPNPADLAYPVFPTYPASLANGPVASGLPNTTQFAKEAIALILDAKNASGANCQQCKTIMVGLQQAMRVQQELLAEISYPICNGLSAVLPVPICVGLFQIASTDVGATIPAMNVTGDDGSLLCAYMFGVCPLPSPPPVNTTALFKGKPNKPAAAPLKPSAKQPLKVIHFSDYHLDPRVFPYTNTSANVALPASLFGNYLCDTPEALATSLFRAIPKVTGFAVDDFAFSIYTGDLVSHDIWELTKPYVALNELEAYQQFYNGFGPNVPVYPTLGNHDTYPHAFTAFPVDTGLPANASYPLQQLWNYQNVSAAWTNYGWLSAADAQSVVNSGLGIYRTMTKEGLIIISLNSDVWYYFNIYNYINGNVADSTGMFSILVDYLLDAEAKSQPVWLIQHVNTGGSTSFEGHPAQTDLWYQIVDRFNNTIRGTFFGHTHADEFGVVYSNNATVKSAQTAAAVGWIAQSVTPYTNLNAGFRYYMVDADTFEVLDSMNYYANISNAAAWVAAGDVQWQFEYSARQTYDYNKTLAPNAPLSPAFWHNVAMDIAGNATTFHTYTDLRTKLFRPYANSTASAKAITICGLTSMSVPIFEACLGVHASITSFL
ncbi:hypothetical protein LTR86_000894 [Recurvomyces mirabilis]|nr:hypothetical protein LTR86_000894 [Recurvomyces mirabilis]